MVDVSKKIEGKKADTLKLSVYSIYDCVLGKFESPFVINSHNLDDFLTQLVNDVQSKYYGKESDFSIVLLGEFDETSGVIYNNGEMRKIISQLDRYIDVKKRNLQTIIQTLNYLPTGYFKMPDEMKKDIQTKIDDLIKKYVEDYVIPDLDVNDISVMKQNLKE